MEIVVALILVVFVIALVLYVLAWAFPKTPDYPTQGWDEWDEAA